MRHVHKATCRQTRYCIYVHRNRKSVCASVARVADAVTAELPQTAVADPFVQQPPQELPELVAEPSFEDLGVDDRLIMTLPEHGIETPSDIQIQAIPRILEGDTLAIQSFTGSGKTLAFLLPVMTMAIRRLEKRVKQKRTGGEDYGPEAIIVTPSRELAMQIVRVAQGLLPEEAWPLVQQLIGGANIRRQLEAMKYNKPLIVVGTPGRMAEHSRMGALRTHRTAAVVLDEVDQLLCQQFRDDMLRILSHAGCKLPDGAPQTVAASATMSPELLSDLRSLLRSKQAIPLLTPFQQPDLVSTPSVPGSPVAGTGGSEPAWGWGSDSGFWAGKGGSAATRGSAGGAMPEGASFASLAPQIVHCHIVEVKRHHVDSLRRLVHALDARHVLVFMNHQDRLKDAVHKLESKGMNAAALHGELSKQKRQSVLQQFRNGTTRVLLVSDVVSRGLDVETCDAVVNLELPSNPAHYAHRAGRTARMGRPGVVCNIVEKQHAFVVEKMSKGLQVEIPQCKSTGGRATIIQDGKVVVLGRYYDEAPAENPPAEQVVDEVQDVVQDDVVQDVVQNDVVQDVAQDDVVQDVVQDDVVQDVVQNDVVHDEVKEDVVRKHVVVDVAKDDEVKDVWSA